MEMNFVGVAAAFATFLGVWMGHVAVRRIERNTIHLWIPIGLVLALGLGFVSLSLTTPNLILSAASGILAVTFLWDALEFVRQQNRIKHGHAPANPNNPRHAKILAEYPEATTFDWLNRDPRGSQYSADELAALKAGAK
ncbi:hypothetical protein ANAEL_03205 [Anaerolineales bacterium]|nr:hypothetical protein ANAEL_03205 [Anaerolineales bacterium]